MINGGIASEDLRRANIAAWYKLVLSKTVLYRALHYSADKQMYRLRKPVDITTVNFHPFGLQ